MGCGRGTAVDLAALQPLRLPQRDRGFDQHMPQRGRRKARPDENLTVGPTNPSVRIQVQWYSHV